MVDSPIGTLTLVGVLDGLSAIRFEGEPTGDVGTPDATLLPHVVDQVAAYFAGDLEAFDVALAPAGTDFHQRVWAGLLDIPFGVTWTYGDLATHIGEGVGASQAVGTANGRNPIPIIIPCHRVIGADGSLTGYAGGIERKRHLLQLEGAILL